MFKNIAIDTAMKLVWFVLLGRRVISTEQSTFLSSISLYIHHQGLSYDFRMVC